ncbi:MAG TPA: carboxypeptidase-like regulatory domain-containing protein, partial [Agriterribacter sp.]|nr:carboxypeptidase-like regulatory domain-containing protein [Agriterribacter sp.]
MRKHICFIICLIIAANTHAQNLIYQIKGKITDTKNNPVESVHIVLKGNENISTTTNATGSFTMVVAQPNNTIMIEKEGFRSQEVEVPFSGNENRVTYVNVTLESMFNKELEEVVIYDNPSLVTNNKLALQRKINEIPGGALLVNLN